MQQSTTPSLSQTVPQPPYSPELAPCDFWLFPKLWGCRYETIEEMKEAVMKVIDTLTQKDLHGVSQKLLEWYNKCIAARGEYFKCFAFMCVLSIKVPMCVLSIKVPIRKKSGNLLYAPPMIIVYLIEWLMLTRRNLLTLEMVEILTH